MANMTKNYNLIMPLQDETYDVDVFNKNFETIDGLIAAIRDMFMPHIGDTIITLDGSNPANRYPGTTWELLEEGTFIRSSGHSIAAGSTGGADNVTIGVKNLPAHAFSGTTQEAGGHNHSGTTAVNGAHSHTASTTSGGEHTHSGSTATTDLSGDFRCRSNTFYGKGMESCIGTQTTTGKFSVRQSGLRSEGNADDNRTEYICHFDGNHAHNFTTDNGGGHGHSISIGTSNGHSHNFQTNSTGSHAHSFKTNTIGGGEAVSIVPRYRSFFIWIRKA